MPSFGFLEGVILTCPGRWVSCGGYVVGCGGYVIGCGGYVLYKMKIKLTPSSSTDAGIGLSLAIFKKSQEGSKSSKKVTERKQVTRSVEEVQKMF